MLFLCFRMPFLHLANSDSTSGPQPKCYFFRDTFHEPQDGAMSPCYGVWQSPLFFLRALMTVMIVMLSSRMWCNVIIRYMPKSPPHAWSSKLVKSQKPGHPCLWMGVSRNPLSRWVMNGQIFMIKIYFIIWALLPLFCIALSTCRHVRPAQWGKGFGTPNFTCCFSGLRVSATCQGVSPTDERQNLDKMSGSGLLPSGSLLQLPPPSG